MTTSNVSFARKCMNATARVVRGLVTDFVVGALAPTLLITGVLSFAISKCGVQGAPLMLVAGIIAVSSVIAMAIMCPMAFVVAGAGTAIVSALWSAGVALKNRFSKSV